MADTFRIIPYPVRSAGTDVPPEEVQAAINSLAQQTTIALNTIVGTPEPPSGPAGGDLSGTYPNPTVTGSHIASGTINGATVGATTPSTGAFTTLTATTPVAVTSGGTGLNALTAHGVVIGEGSSAPNFVTGTTGQVLLGVTGADPAFGNNPTITGGSINNTPVGATTPSTGSFTTLAASGAVSGAGFTARFATPGPIGNTTASTGAFTTLSSTGTFTPSSTAGIVGTTTNDNANAGSVGEYVTATASGVSLSSGAVTNIASISLTAGDWDVSGVVRYNPSASTTMSGFLSGVSSTSATFGPLGSFTQFSVQIPAGAGTAEAISSPVTRFSLASTTTVFLIGDATFAVSTLTADGFIRARRVR